MQTNVAAAWPRQSDCDRFYGNPRGVHDAALANPAWESMNLVTVTPPFRMTYAGQPIRGIRFHHRAAEALACALCAIWDAADHRQATVDQWGASIFGGSYNYRLMRGRNALSMHSYGCAIDLDPARNALHDTTPHFAQVPQVVKAFADQGATWGGSWAGASRDGMHFQFANV